MPKLQDSASEKLVVLQEIESGQIGIKAAAKKSAEPIPAYHTMSIPSSRGSTLLLHISLIRRIHLPSSRFQLPAPSSNHYAVMTEMNNTICIGYTAAVWPGSLMAALGIALPSTIVMFTVAIFFFGVYDNYWVQSH